MPYGRKKTPEDIKRLKSYEGKPIDPNKPITKKEKKFLELLVYEDYVQWKAYDVSYPPRTRQNNKDTYIHICCEKANRLLKKANVQRKYQEMKKEMQEKLLNKAIWTKEEAIEKLKNLIDRNESEQKRIDESYEAQIDMLFLKIQESETPNEKEQLLNQVISLRAKIRNSQVNNNAVLSAISELNKMHGYNSQEITVKHNEEFEIDKKLAQLTKEELIALAYPDEQN